MRLRRAATMMAYPMSPFAVRREIKYHQLSKRFELIPICNDPPFQDFMELVKEAESSRRDQAPVALVEAEALRQKIDDVLLGDRPGAIWCFLADRSLPEEARQGSVRLQRRKDKTGKFCSARRITEDWRTCFGRPSMIATSGSITKIWRPFWKKALISSAAESWT